MIRSVLHEYLAANSTVATVQCVSELLVIIVDLQGSSEHSNTLVYSMCRALFNYCQTKIVVIKERSELDDDVQLDAAEEVPITAGK